MLASRISRALSVQGKPLQFDAACNKVFLRQEVSMGTRQKNKMPIFDYITRSTHLRPRDYIRYLQVCAHEALETNNKIITANIVKRMDKSFSNYLRNELVDEIHGILPDIQEILSILSEIRKWNFSIGEFKRRYKVHLNKGVIKTRDVDFVLKVLFHFSVIGNQGRQKNQSFFRYANKEARLNFSEQLVVHRGLFKALQIL